MLYESAKTLLLYAKSIDPNYNPVNVNLGMLRISSATMRKLPTIIRRRGSRFSYHDDLTPDEYNELTDLAQSFRDNANQSYRQILQNLPSSGASGKMEEIINMGCDLSSGEQLLFMAFGEENVSFEPSACFMILCVSMDHQGMGAVQLSAVVVSAKVGVNPFTGDTAIQFGIGPGEVGIGPVTAEASLYVKIEGNGGEFERVGLQPTIGLGPLEVGYFFLGLKESQTHESELNHRSFNCCAEGVNQAQSGMRSKRLKR